MTKFHKGYTKDPIYSKINMDFEDDVNFFEGRKVEVVKKEPKEDDTQVEDDENKEVEPTDEEVQGMERLIIGLGKVTSDRSILLYPEVEGTEGIINTGKKFLQSLWQLIKDIGNWIKSLFSNKIARVDARIEYTKQRRKMDGIKEGMEVKYPTSVLRLAIPNKITTEGDWVYICAEEGMKFFETVSGVIKGLDVFIKKDVTDLDKAKLEVMASIAKDLTNKQLKDDSQVETDVLPGNRVYIVKSPVYDNPQAALTFYGEANTTAKPKGQTFKVTAPLIDNAIKVLGKYGDAILKAQADTSELQRKFEREVETLMRKDDITPERRMFLSWLVYIHKRLVSTTLQNSIQSLISLDDFINAGLK